MMKYILAILLFVSSSGFAADMEIESFNWNGIEVIWLEDSKFPTYGIMVYFGDGALGDGKGKEGETSFMLDMLGNGTPKYSQAQISDLLDFYGVGIGSNVTHEYSTMGFSGLVKDIVPVTDLICHVVNEASFPKDELSSYKKKVTSSLRNLVASHGSLADRIFRKISLKETPFSSHVNGSLKSINDISRESLMERKKFFNKKVYKKIFMTGPREMLKVKDTIISKCGWEGKKPLFKRTGNPPKDLKKLSTKSHSKVPLYFASIKGANQAQIRVGSFLPANYFQGANFDLSKLSSAILGGSFTSLLMQELRVKRGLTYGAFSAAAPQALYGRSIISTSTKSETVLEALYTIRDTLNMLTKGKVTKDRFEATKKYLKGKHLFQFESNASFLSSLVMFDHLGRRYSEIFEFPENIEKFSKKDLVNLSNKLFGWSSQTVFVLGDDKLKEKIKKSQIFDVKEVKVNSYL